jgi:hypothetical protein
MRDIETLREPDINDFPVWRYSGGETNVIPVKKLPCANLVGKIVGTYVTLSNGTRVPAILGNMDVDDKKVNDHFLTISILFNEKWFHLARYHDFDFDSRGPIALAAFLKLRCSDVFPIEFDVSSVVKGSPSACRGLIVGDVKDKLSEDELMELIVPVVQKEDR